MRLQILGRLALLKGAVAEVTTKGCQCSNKGYSAGHLGEDRPSIDCRVAVVIAREASH
jgi:hypothetical protein